MNRYKKYFPLVILAGGLIMLFVAYIIRTAYTPELGVWSVEGVSSATRILLDTGTTGNYCELNKNKTFTLCINSTQITGSYKRELLNGGNIKLMLSGEDGTDIIGTYGKKYYFDGEVEDTIILSTGDKVMTLYKAD